MTMTCLTAILGGLFAIEHIDKKVYVQFPDKQVAYDTADLGELVLAYATTIHKAQGSEYPAVVIPCTHNTI